MFASRELSRPVKKKMSLHRKCLSLFPLVTSINLHGWEKHEVNCVNCPVRLLFISSTSFALFEMVSSENQQCTLKLSQPLTKNKGKKRRIVLKSYLTAARQGLHKNREAILMAFSIPANSHALGASLTPAGWKLRSHAGSRLRANFSRLIENCELLPSSLTQFPKIC